MRPPAEEDGEEEREGDGHEAEERSLDLSQGLPGRGEVGQEVEGGP